MGRKKVVMKRIEDKSSRQVTFSKRRSGLIKKARELSILCDVEVALVIFSSRGKLYEFCSAGNSVDKIVQRYQSNFEAEGKVSPGGCEAESSLASFRTSSELLQIVKRHLEEPSVKQLSVTELVQLEREIDAALIQTKSRKTQLLLESVTALQEKEQMLREENKHLAEEIAAIESDGNKASKVIMEFEDLPNTHLNCHSQRPLLHLL